MKIISTLFLATISIFLTCTIAVTAENNFKEISSYTAGGKKWINILVPEGTTRGQLKKIALKLHKKNPNKYFHIFDNDKKLQDYIDWEKHYPNTPSYSFPEAWVFKHLLGDINQMLSNGSLQWQLTDSWGIKIINLQ